MAARLARLCVMLVTVSAARPSQAATVDQQFSRLRENGCLPDDVASLGAAGCRGDSGQTQELGCIASGAGISTPVGYDQAAVDTYLGGLSSDEGWVLQQQKHLANCSSMLLDQVPAEAEGTFLLACWHQLLMSDCNRRKMVNIVEVVDAENAEKLVKEIANLAEGPCFDAGLKYAEGLGMKWADCTAKNDLDMGVLTDAAYLYFLFSQGQEIPDPSVESNARALEQLDRLNATAHCYAMSTGEVKEDDSIDYDLINEATRNAVGRNEFKVVDKAFVEYCRDQDPASIGDFYSCFNMEKPFACAVLKSYDIALGRIDINGALGVKVPTVAPTAVSFIAGILGSIF